MGETRVGGGKRQYEYDTRDRGRTLRRFDDAGRVVAEVGPDAIEREYVFDDFGDMVEERDDGATTRHRYDAFGLVVASVLPDGSKLKYERDVCGRPTEGDWGRPRSAPPG